MPQKGQQRHKRLQDTKGQQDHKRSTIQPHNRLGFQGTQEKQAHKLELAKSPRRTQIYAPNARASPSLPNSNKATQAIGGIREEEHKRRTQNSPRSRSQWFLHEEGIWLGWIVDLDLLSQIPQKDARIIRGK